jgi:hypothetical protein
MELRNKKLLIALDSGQTTFCGLAEGQVCWIPHSYVKSRLDLR